MHLCKEAAWLLTRLTLDSFQAATLELQHLMLASQFGVLCALRGKGAHSHARCGARELPNPGGAGLEQEWGQVLPNA